MKLALDVLNKATQQNSPSKSLSDKKMDVACPITIMLPEAHMSSILFHSEEMFSMAESKDTEILQQQKLKGSKSKAHWNGRSMLFSYFFVKPNE